MPFNAGGGFHMNPQVGRFKDKMDAGKPKPAMSPAAKAPMGKKPEEKMSGNMSELHDNGDGSFHTKSADGEEMDHPHIGHALIHLGAKHAEGKHVHVHEDGMGMMSHHHMGHGSGVEGPHEQSSPEEAGDHVKDVLGGESNPESDGPDLSMLGEEQ